MKNIFYTIIIALFATLFSACKKEYTDLYKDNRPEIPVTYEGAITHGFNPYITQPLSKNEISFTLTIPSGSGRTIKEISKVLAGTTAVNAGGVRAGTYIAAPIRGDGTRAVFNTTIAAFKASSAGNLGLIERFEADANARQLQIAFMFLVKLDNDQEIIPVQAQVWLTK